MVELEHLNDRMINDDIWEVVRRKEVTVEEVEEFKETYRDMLKDVESEFLSLSDNYAQFVKEIEDSLKACYTCGDSMDSGREGEYCEDCDDTKDCDSCGELIDRDGDDLCPECIRIASYGRLDNDWTA